MSIGKESHPRRRSLAVWISVAYFVLNTMALLTYHNMVPTAAAIPTDPMSAPQTENHGISTIASFPTFSALDIFFFIALTLTAFELLDFLTKNSGRWLGSQSIPVRGKHLDDLRPIDLLFIGFSKANTPPFTYFLLRYCWTYCIWDMSQLAMVKTLLPIPCLYIIFDLPYSILHWLLHFQSLYPHIHKHHHIQKAPSRANVDAVNVHPIEYVLGEYNHILALWFWTQCLGLDLHVVGAVAFVGFGGILAGINHTRFDVSLQIPVPTRQYSKVNGYWRYVTLYDSKAHDVHHRIPQSNYGQYTMFWDHVFGSFREYNPNDRVNPQAQLDSETGKTIKLEKAQ